MAMILVLDQIDAPRLLPSGHFCWILVASGASHHHAMTTECWESIQ
jgi:hypothetical protein